ncbi:hypothetical protein TspCOW1_15200 [Thiohalobacter sp. COW1]|uniref:Iron transporter n=1 Tax=Thiohalobacter thiocyanaticus TaxID=585455 RepID=A0A1Z4VPL5_9GAMM|nr:MULTISPECIES: hypothetical protein [Thiohalobacter]BAZ93541.1 uncharacterized protein FOKN1_1142 [Thiohalobacter thiocyanaticus]BCO31417.1 hypothetical protein TspCOW1_15200 [Thiohalobacter sp. COW1]
MKQGLVFAQQIGLALAGGYGLSVLLTMLLARALSGLLARSEAVVLSAMLGFVVYLLVLLWAFAERRLPRLWLVLGGGGIAALVMVLLHSA